MSYATSMTYITYMTDLDNLYDLYKSYLYISCGGYKNAHYIKF